MRSVKYLLIVAGLLGVGSVFVACGDDDTDNKDTDKPQTTDDGKETDDTDTGTPSTDEEETESETVEPVHPDVAFEENFDAWEGGGSMFFMAKPEDEADALEGNNTAANIGGQDCVMFAALSQDNGADYGTAIEVQFQLLEMGVDMSGEDYEISFDVYLTQDMKDKNVQFQFSFFTPAPDYTPIYSKLYGADDEAETWHTYKALVKNDGETITYSGFGNLDNEDYNPTMWQFDVVRIQALIPNPEDETDTEAAADGQEITFYLDNLSVKLAE